MATASTIGEALAARAARNSDSPAIVHPGLGTISFGTLVARLQEIDRQLQAAGLGPNARVGIALPRGPEAALLSVAVCCRAILVPINPNLAPADLQAELARIRLHALIVQADAPVPEWVAAAGDGFGLFLAKKAVTSFEQVALEQVRPVPDPPPAADVTAQSWAAIFKTSGTTGVSKRVPVTHENLIEMARKMERWLKLGPADRSACIMPIYYNAGFKATLLVPLLIGCSVALPESPSPNDFDRWVEELRPTWLTSAPPFLQAVVEKLSGPQVSAPPRHALRFVLSTASYLPEATRREAERLLAIPVVEFYGLCEAGMMTAPAFPAEDTRPGSVGRIPEGELAIRDDDGAFLRAGQTGQVVLRGPSVMPGYLFDDIEGVPSGLQDGWLATGDLGTVDADGFLTIAGRSKEIINRGGEKISPYDVEKALLQHPAVREAAAFAVPHPRLGENVGAAVVLHPGAEATSVELIDFIYDRLAPFQMPRHIHVVDSLPVGATNKISRPSLSAAFANHQRPRELPGAPLELQIAEIWQRFLKLDEIGMDDDFFEIGGDSLQATEMLLELEEITRHRIAPSEVRAQLTIRQLSETLSKAAAAKEEVMTQVRSGPGVPLFVCHGDFCGWGFYAFRLAELLKHDGPVYLLHSILDEAKGIRTIEEMVRRYLPHIEAAASDGPVRLAGYCHGGIASLEIAGQLERRGRIVDKIVLIDTFSLNARPLMRGIARLASFAGRIVPGIYGHRIRRSAMPSIWVLVSHILNRDRATLNRVARAVRSETVRARGMSRAWGDSQQSTYFRAMAKYVPPRTRAEMLCLLCDDYAGKKEYDPGPWKHIAADVQYERIPGQHNTCITAHVRELAVRMNRALVA
jgi:acyl-CoA synthetase (AMP-forming)/AMP-acid ligase II/thioesterase domain-containing protein/acyl carrier protein